MASSDKLILVDKIKWWESEGVQGARVAVPLCPQHNLRLTAVTSPRTSYSAGVSFLQSKELRCEEGPHSFKLPREYRTEQAFVLNKIDAQIFSQMPVLNLDDEAIPVAKEQMKDPHNPYWVRAKVTKSKSGDRLIIWAGNKDTKNKTQLFVEPETKRLSFDQNDDHPMEVFAKVEATFAGGVQAGIQKKLANTKKPGPSQPTQNKTKIT